MRSLIFGTTVAALIVGPFAVSRASATEAKCEPAALGTKYPSLVEKIVKVAQDPQGPPYAFRDPENFDTLIGLDADLVRAAFACIGVPFEFGAAGWLWSAEGGGAGNHSDRGSWRGTWPGQPLCCAGQRGDCAMGYFSGSLTPVPTVQSGDFVTIETLTHQAYDDHPSMIGRPGCGERYLLGEGQKRTSTGAAAMQEG